MATSSQYPKPDASVDTILFARKDRTLQVQLMRRPTTPGSPFPGEWALPGGYVHVGPNEDPDLERTAKRVLAEKAQGSVRYMEQLCTVGSPDRDPRGWSIAVAYIALVDSPVDLDPSSGWQWVNVDSLPPLAFDHNQLIARGVERLRNKAQYSSLPVFLLPEAFTLPDLIELYQDVLQTHLDHSAFRRKVLDQHLIEAVDGQRRVSTGAGRPAQLYRLAQEHLHDFGRVLSSSSTEGTVGRPKRSP